MLKIGFDFDKTLYKVDSVGHGLRKILYSKYGTIAYLTFMFYQILTKLNIKEKGWDIRRILFKYDINKAELIESLNLKYLLPLAKLATTLDAIVITGSFDFLAKHCFPELRVYGSSTKVSKQGRVTLERYLGSEQKKELFYNLKLEIYIGDSKSDVFNDNCIQINKPRRGFY